MTVKSGFHSISSSRVGQVAVLIFRYRNNNVSVKRQRTSSRSASPPAEKPDDVEGDASEDDMETRNGSKKARKNRHQREKSEKEDKDRQRQEATSKRKGRAERRRADGINPILWPRSPMSLR